MNKALSIFRLSVWLFLICLSSNVEAAPTHFGVSNSSADATWNWSSSDGCSIYYLNVRGSESGEQDTGKSVVDGVMVTFYDNNVCTYITTSWWGYAESGADYSSNTALSFATLQASLPVSGYTYDANTDTQVDIYGVATIDISWAGSGPLSKATDNQKYFHPDDQFRLVIYQVTGSYRGAEATGTITLDDGPNLVPEQGQADVLAYLMYGKESALKIEQ